MSQILIKLFEKVPHLGEVRQVTLAQASLDKRLMLRLSKQGTSTASTLRRVAGNSCTQQDVDESISRLFEWGMVTLNVGETSRTILVSLTEAGLTVQRNELARQEILTTVAAE